MLLITPADQRTPYTRHNALEWLVSFVAIATAAHIRYRHPSTPLLVRLVIAIVGIAYTTHVRCAHYVHPDDVSHPQLAIIVDMHSVVIAFLTAVAVLDYLFVGDAKEHAVCGAPPHTPPPLCFPGTLIPLELDVLWSPRGIGYGRGMPQHNEPYKAGYEAVRSAHALLLRPLHEARAIKHKHLAHAVRIAVSCYALLDVGEAFLRHPLVLPDYRDYAAMSVDDAAIPYVLSVTLCAMIITMIQFVSSASYAVALLCTPAYDAPLTIARWQPLAVGQPHRSTSLRAFWGRHWHAYLRRTFVVAGYKPAHALATRIGLPKRATTAAGVMGAFLASGLCHEICLDGLLPHQQHLSSATSADVGFGARHYLSTRFFLAMGVGVCVEDAWTGVVESHIAATLFHRRRLASGRVRSVLGWTWCMTYVLYFGHRLIDLWLAHGIGIIACTAQLSRPLVDVIVIQSTRTLRYIARTAT